MSGDWTPKKDEWVMVQATGGIEQDGKIALRYGAGCTVYADPTSIRAIPPAMTPEERAVIEAAMVWQATRQHLGALEAAVNILAASRDAETPLRLAIAAWEKLPPGPSPERAAARAKIAAAVGVV
jgi:hypothetical protein